MSFNIRLMLNNSASNVADKDFTTIDTLTGALRNETSVTDPVIRIEADVNTLAQCNYFYIPQFHRYYFLNDVRSVRNGIVEINGHCDVLTTAFKLGSLSDCMGITKRQQTDWNLDLNDGYFKVYQNPIITTELFPSGFNTFQYILAVAGSAQGNNVSG